MNTENPALLILEEIAEGKDILVEVAAKEAEKVYKDVKTEPAKEKEEPEVEEDEDEEDLELVEEEEEETQEVLSD